MDDHRVGADLRARADVDRPQQLRPRADHHVGVNGRVTLPTREASPAERDPLVERHVVADLRGLPDHDAGAVVDEEGIADPCRRMNLDARRDPADVSQAMRDHRNARLVHRVRDPVHQQRLDAAVGEQDLQPAESASSGIALLRRGQVLPQLAPDTRQGPETEHR